MQRARPRVAIIVGTHGRGTNMAALVTTCHSGFVPAEAALVVGPRAGSPALLRAAALGVSTLVLNSRVGDFPRRLIEALRDARVDWVCLAGYMQLLPPEVLEAYPNRVLNIHPSLLPKFGGQGMYGIHVHRAVLDSGDQVSGCTIHFVTSRYDEGRVLHQRECPIEPTDTPESLADRILDIEVLAYPEALRMAIESTNSA